MGLAGRVAVVTGAGSGLGRATAVHLARAHDMRLALLDLDFGGREAELAAEIGREAVSFHVADITDAGQLEAAFGEIGARWPALHACINAAGIAGSMRMLDERPLAERFDAFRRTIAVNLTGSFMVMTHAAEAMLRNAPQEPDGERGVIVNFSSIAALEGAIGHIAYGASKAGILGLTMPAARELARHGIRVATVSPGFFDTPMTAGIKPSARERMAAGIQFPKRLGSGEELARLVGHILGNRYINGANLRIDGGIRLG